jgi:hypothetical protein
MVTKRNKFNPEREGQLLYISIKFQKIVFWKLAFCFHGYFAIVILAIIRRSKNGNFG